MADLSSILGSLGGVASSLASHIVPGADKLIEAGEAVLKAFDTVKAASDTPAPVDAEAAHKILLDKVRTHADETLGKLESGG